MNSLPTKVRTAWALGPMSLSRVAAYRLGLRAGLHPALSITARIPPGPYFLTASPSPVKAPARLADLIAYFGWKQAPLDKGRPDWFRSPFGTESAPNSDLPWWKISDFDPAVGDIKAIWEPSRFGWALDHARAARNGDAGALPTLNDWLTDWVSANPAYQGPNWKCGQETSIRVMHLAASALVLGSAKDASPALAKLLEAHLLRIAPTIRYAIGQDNNHGTSEAAALFIGGDWLAGSHPQAQKWHARGRALLEDRARRLIAEDGTFSQYSVTYHRLMLDTYALAEVWRRRHALPEFSATLRRRLAAAARWLRELVDQQSGDAPNLGANDGAHILRLTEGDYRDFRPSVQLATALFDGTIAFEGDGDWNAAFAWLDVDLPALPAQPLSSRLLDDGGLALLRDRRNLAMLRYPRFRFRPSQADALHVDFWRDGQNLLRDGGSYSYADAQWNAYFAGTRSHNTVEFDDRDQMPRLGRFLFGDWLATELVSGLQQEGDRQTVSASYRGRMGARHARKVELAPDRLVVVDDIEGLRQKAVLRWRLQPGEWQVDGSTVTDGHTRLSIEASMPIGRIEIVPGWEARYYLAKSKLPVLEVEVGSAGRLTSSFEFGA